MIENRKKADVKMSNHFFAGAEILRSDSIGVEDVETRIQSSWIFHIIF